MVDGSQTNLAGSLAWSGQSPLSWTRVQVLQFTDMGIAKRKRNKNLKLRSVWTSKPLQFLLLALSSPLYQFQALTTIYALLKCPENGIQFSMLAFGSKMS